MLRRASSAHQGLPPADLVTYKPRPKAGAAQNLLQKGEAPPAPADQVQDSMAEKGLDTVWWALFKPNVSISLVDEGNVHPANAVPPWVGVPLAAHVCGKFCRDVVDACGISIALGDGGSVLAATAMLPWAEHPPLEQPSP